MTALPSLLIASALLCLASFALADAQCGDSCVDNGGCKDIPVCTYCNPDTKSCSPGLPCGAECADINDCNASGPCKICRIGHCTSDGECGSYCTSSDDCYGASCKTCDVNKNQCVSPCGGTCSSNKDCGLAGGPCGQCIAGICQVGGCGAHCNIASDCMNQGNCTQCLFNKCFSGCDGNCTTNQECNDAYSTCGICNADGKCEEGNVCDMECANNNQCAGSCSRCANGQCKPGFGCGDACKVSSDCSQLPTACSECIAGKCDHPLAKRNANPLAGSVGIN
eukprot:TRINITY_DN2070_c0_g1_i1.p2 TRINITY_DN2070_c0_g1~~TRINITY_DN2070_c0_g1_i1.p2  ORF type:complete len:290 (-),score=67.81 TRINITY_DN2070_c0_g1_i1:162-1001(-)